MDRECALLLPGVCAVLAGSGSSLPDDTSLEKLLDWFTGITEAGGSLLEACPCLLKLICTVVHNAASDPGVLSFALRLTGLLAATEESFKTIQEHSVLNEVFNLQHWQEAGLWEDPCLRIGWIQGLRSMLQHPKALSFFVQSEFIDPLLQLQTDTSLFIAAAANQMLAHILLFFQSVPPGVDKKEKGDGMTPSSADYTAVVKSISGYLQESLVPKESKNVRQSLQTLKLLALLLAQAGPPLRDKLLQTVGDSLEELVAAGSSELTLPLMDVLLSACSSSGTDERITRLLSSMLNINKPADLIHAAAAFLRRGHHDTVHTARAVRILLLPLDIMTGQTLLGSISTADEHQFSVVEQLKSKSSCISMICVCLSNTPQITLTPPDVLPCLPVSIVTAVLSLLKICSGNSPSSSTGCSEVSRNVIGSGKVQKCALEALTTLTSSPGAKERISEVFTVLIQYLENPDSDPTVLHKSYQALLKWTSVCTDFSFITDQLRHDLVEVVKKRVCDMRWEVKDSTVEFLGHLAGVCDSIKAAAEGRDASEALLGACSTTPLLREALQDSESYVRASTISALAKTLTHRWQQGATLTEEESVRSVLSQGRADLDWEVKVHTLVLAELLLDEAFSGHPGYKKGSDSHHASPHAYGVVSEQAYTLHTHTATHTEGAESDLAVVVEKGVISVLLSGLVDCDRPVALKACRLLITLRETVCPLSLGALDASAAMATVSCELPGCGWGREIIKILKMKKSDQAKEEDIADQRGLNGAEEGGDSVCVSVCEALRSLGLDERMEVLTQSSDHIHNSPLSLLQDILTASATHTKPGEEVIVDCY
ncbi:hypothetical protein CesoFtcFv8_008727 [Champsocephalus esox]|uniref:BRCA1-associated ATM activator 1 n=1 Tax=Champsocephalus esox TaxID=159716 RepID=A0AAN8H1X6_9TELE|nr:hypothetical protein CesoFtcFv8_008727 [Champsocephalus esox]